MSKDNKYLPPIKKITKATYVALVCSTYLIQAVAMVQGILLARHLGPEKRGELAAIILIPTVFAQLSNLGIHSFFSREAARRQYGGENIKSLVFSSLIAAVATSLVFILGCSYYLAEFYPEVDPSLKYLSYLFCLVIPFYNIDLNMRAMLKGLAEVTLINRSAFFKITGSTLFLIVLIVFDQQNLAYFVVLLLASELILMCMNIYSVVKKFGIELHIERITQMYSKNWNFFISNVLGVLTNHIDRIILVYLLPSRELGIYAAAVAAGGITSHLAASSVLITYALSVSNKHDNLIKVIQTIKLTLIFSFVFGSILFILMPYIIDLLYGSAFREAIYPAQILITGLILKGTSESVSSTATAQGKAFFDLEGKILVISMLLIIGPFQIAKYGIVGLAYVYTMVQLITCCYLLFKMHLMFREHKLSQHYLIRFKDFIYIAKSLNIFIKKLNLKFKSDV